MAGMWTLLLLWAAVLATVALGAASAPETRRACKLRASKDANLRIVSFKRGTPEKEVQAHLKWVNELTPKSASGRPRISKEFNVGNFRAYIASLDQGNFKKVQARGEVADIARDKARCPRATDTWASQYDGPWGLRAISRKDKLPRASSLLEWKDAARRAAYMYDSEEGRGTFAYIIDSGIKLDHEDIRGRAFLGADCGWGDGTCRSGQPSRGDNHGHGTHIAGIIGGTRFGVAKAATLVDVRLDDDEGNSAYFDFLAGFEWALRDIGNRRIAGRSVINLSNGDDCTEASNFEECRKFFQDDEKNGGSRHELELLNVARDMGVLVVTAAGNAGIPAEWSVALRHEASLVVGSLDQKFREFYGSNYGSAVHVLAPGVDIESADVTGVDASSTRTGTSFAVPHVVGQALVFLSAGGIRGAAALKKKIIDMARDDAVIMTVGTYGMGRGVARAATGREGRTPNKRLYNGFQARADTRYVPGPRQQRRARSRSLSSGIVLTWLPRDPGFGPPPWGSRGS